MADDRSLSARFYLACICSGVAWGMLVFVLLLGWGIPFALRAGFFFSPLLGVLAGQASVLIKDSDNRLLIAITAQVTLYVTSALWGFSPGQRSHWLRRVFTALRYG